MFKYIKKLSLILAVIMLATSLSSCAANTNTPDTTSSTTGNTTQQSTSASIDTPTTPEIPTVEYEALAYGFTDSVTGINAKIEFDINNLNDKYYIKENPDAQSLTWNGKQYDGKYKQTITSPSHDLIKNEYEYRNDDNSFYLRYRVDETTGELVTLYLVDSNYEENSKGKNKYSEEECLDIAMKFIKAQNIDMEHLKLEETIYRDYLYDGFYTFKFYHYIDDFRIVNNVHIRITVYGDIVYYKEYMPFDIIELKESNVLKGIDYNAAEEALKIKTDEIFGTGEATSLYEYEYLHSTKTLSRVNGKLILICQTYVDVSYKKNGTNVPGYSFISVIFLE